MIYNRTMTATVYPVDKKSGRLLLHMHKKFGELYPLGGHIEPDELPHEAALREVLEESGARVSLVDERGEEYAPESGFILPPPAFLLRENTNKPVENLDFVYIAFLPEELGDISSLDPMSGESKDFFLVEKAEAEEGRIRRGEREIPIPPHIRRIALGVFGILEKMPCMKGIL